MSEKSESIAGDTNPVESMSFEALVAQRTQARTFTEEPELEESNEDEPEDEAEESDETEGEIEDEESGEESEEQEPQSIDLESLTPEEIKQLAAKGKSRLLQRFGELTAKNKALEEKLASQAEAKPLPKSIPQSENPFSTLKTVAEIQAKREELEKVADDTDRILDEYEHFGPDDLITVSGHEYTKAQIKTARRNAQQGLLKFLPAQEAEIERASQRKVHQEQFDAAIPLQIPEMADEDSELFQQFKAMRDDPLTEKVRQSVPELSPQFNWLLAHAANSILKSKTPVRKPAAVTPRPKVTGTPFGAGAAKSGSEGNKDRVKRATAQFEESGSEEALIAARAARHANR